MEWTTGLSVASSVLGGFGGGSKAGERAMRDAAGLQMANIEAQNRVAQKNAQPYIDSGIAANSLLSRYLGTALPAGYESRPTYQQAYDTVWADIYNKAGGKGFRQTNISGVHGAADALYKKKLSQWETGLEQYKKSNPNAGDPNIDGRLLRQFTNEDFVEDPGHQFELAEGEKGVERSLASRGQRNSGAALKALDRYNSDFASTKFNDAYNRDSNDKANTYNFLSGQSSQGLNAAQNTANMSLNLANASANRSQDLNNTLLQQSNQRQDNMINGITSGIGNYIYGTERAKNSSVTGATPPYVPSNFQSNNFWGGR